MSKCLNCGGELRYDIEKQKLSCGQCGSLFDPYEYDRQVWSKEAGNDRFMQENSGGNSKEADEETEEADEETGYSAEMFKVMTYTCPECGGTIVSMSDSAVGYCTYCGSQSVLKKSEEEIRKPDYIQPFRVTRQEVGKITRRRLGKAFFAPKEIRKPDSAEAFRGIYIPYWLYDIKSDALTLVTGTLPGTRKGDYIYQDTYKGTIEGEISYGGIPFDASSSFDDEIGRSVAPFEAAQTVDFTPSYMSGFYADTADVSSGVYREDAMKAAEADAEQRIRRDGYLQGNIFKGGDLEYSKDIFTERNVTPHLALLPVWFAAFRKNGRVAYSIINGQTGEEVSDLPIDGLRYLILSLICAIPLYLLFDSFAFANTKTALAVTCFLMLAARMIGAGESARIWRRDNRLDDRGWVSIWKKRNGAPKGWTRTGWNEAASQNTEKKKIKNVRTKAKSSGFLLFFVLAWGGIPMAIVVVELIAEAMRAVWPVIAFMLAVSALYSFLQYGKTGEGIANEKINSFDADKVSWAKEPRALRIFTDVLAGLAIVLSIVNPITDELYYTLSALIIADVYLQILQIIRKYNVYATRPMPQFFEKGGDNSVQ